MFPQLPSSVDPPGRFVYVVGEDSTVSVRPVKLGISQGNDVAIDDGLSPNERVVVDGAEKLTEGMQVSVHQPGEAPSVRPAFRAS